MVLRQRGTDANGTLEELLYSGQNWRQDVVAMIMTSSSGNHPLLDALLPRCLDAIPEHTSYGVPNPRPAGDVDDDGSCTSTDINGLDNPPGVYDVRYDPNLDGSMDSSDSTYASNNFLGVTLGWNILSNPAIDNNRGYAGYRWKQNTSKYEVRNRVYDPHLGRWLRRDPLGYVDGMNLFEYVSTRPIISLDPFGLSNNECSEMCTWDVHYSVWNVGLLWWYGRMKFDATGIDDTGDCLFYIKGSGWSMGGAFGMGWQRLSSSASGLRARCCWPIKPGDSHHVAGPGTRIGIEKASIDVAYLDYEIGELSWRDWNIWGSGGIGYWIFGFGAGGEVTKAAYQGPCDPPDGGVRYRL